jgi:hypothetical protein
MLPLVGVSRMVLPLPPPTHEETINAIPINIYGIPFRSPDFFFLLFSGKQKIVRHAIIIKF